jgi:hypothetical protein
MKLTRSELLAAARRARVYPAEHGYRWGYGPLAESQTTDLSQHPKSDLIRYG